MSGFPIYFQLVQASLSGRDGITLSKGLQADGKAMGTLCTRGWKLRCLLLQDWDKLFFILYFIILLWQLPLLLNSVWVLVSLFSCHPVVRTELVYSQIFSLAYPIVIECLWYVHCVQIYLTDIHIFNLQYGMHLLYVKKNELPALITSKLFSPEQHSARIQHCYFPILHDLSSWVQHN